MPARLRDRIAELSFLGLFALIAAIAFLETRVTLVEKRAASGDAFSNSALFIEIIAGLMVLVILVIAAQAVVTRSAGTAPGDADDDRAELDRPALWRLAGFLLIVTFCVAAFRILGYYIAVPLTVAAMLALMGTRAPLAYAVFPLAVTLVIGFVFEILFNVVLPLGFLGLTLQSVFG